MPNRIKAAIIDDNIKSIQVLEDLISNLFLEINIVGTATTYDEGVNLLKSNNLDLIFLDVNLTKTITGFNVLDNFKNSDFSVIIISAFKNYALEAFKYNVVGYILKPIDVEKLITTVNRFIDLQKSNKNLDQPLEFLPIQSLYKIDITPINEIIYLIADGKYTNFICTDKQKIISSQNLKYFENKLENNNFFRVHKSYLINLNYLKTIEKRDGFYCIMSDDTKIPISRRKKDAFLDHLN